VRSGSPENAGPDNDGQKVRGITSQKLTVTDQNSMMLNDSCIVGQVIERAPVLSRQILSNSATQFVKFREIPRHYYPQISYIPRPVGIVTDSTWKYIIV